LNSQIGQNEDLLASRHHKAMVNGELALLEGKVNRGKTVALKSLDDPTPRHNA
jgi:hypothetical protein